MTVLSWWHRRQANKYTKHFSLKNVLDKAILMINVIKSQLLNAHLFIFCVMHEEACRKHFHFCCLAKHNGGLRAKHLCVWVESSINCLFLMEHHFYLQGWLTGKLWFFRLGYSADIFSKMNKTSLSLRGKQLTVFVSQDKSTSFQAKIRILENLFLPPWAWQLLNT